MRSLIKERGHIRYEVNLTDSEIELIINKYFLNLIKDGHPWIKGIDCAIKAFLEQL